MDKDYRKLVEMRDEMDNFLKHIEWNHYIATCIGDMGRMMLLGLVAWMLRMAIKIQNWLIRTYEKNHD